MMRRIATQGAVVAACLAAPVAVATAADPAAELYDPGRMHVIELSLQQKDREKLEADSDKYVAAKFSLAETDGTPDGVEAFSTPLNIKMKLKGSASRRPLSGKSAFKIKFEEASFRGLRTMTLNSMVEDPSMIHETLAYTVFRGAGVPAPRTGYAYVYVDGEDYGVHLNIETLDRVALEKIFGSFQPDVEHLYESEYEAEVTPDREWMFEIDEGDGDRSDLKALVQRVNSDGSTSWAEHVAPVADLDEMTRMWAGEKYIGQWDGYAGTEAPWLPNNYYLHSDPNGVFRMLPSGNDESFQQAYHLDFDGPAGLMFDRCLADASCGALYRGSVATVRDAVAGMDLDSLALGSAALLAPWQEMEDDESTREEHSLEEIAEGVAETREFIATRPAEAAEWLGDDLEPDPNLAGPTSVPPGSSNQVGLPGPSLKVIRTWEAGGVLHTQIRLRTSGTVAQRALIATGKKGRVVCRDQAQVEQPRDLTLHCSLPTAIRKRLQQRWLGLTVATRFLPSGGSSENVARRITLPRG